MSFVPSMERVFEGSELRAITLGHPLVDAYLEFVGARGAMNTWLATAYDLKVFFGVVGKEPAEVTSALACEIELDLGRRLDLHASHSQLILYTFELADFVDQLRALEHAPDGQATLGDPDEQSGDELGLTITLNDGQGTLAGFLADSTTTRLRFETIDIDRSFLSDMLAQLATILDAFPVRGDPAAD
jgi:hypothetical protein